MDRALSRTRHRDRSPTRTRSRRSSTQLEREAIFKRAWLQVGRVEQIPRSGSFFTKEIAAANTSIIVVRDGDGEVRAFHNICRHRGNKLVWNDFPQEETSGTARQFACKYHGWRYGLDGACTFVQQEGEFFDLDKAELRPGAGALRRVRRLHLRELRRAAEPVAARVPRADAARHRGLPVRRDDRPLRVPGRVPGELEGLLGRLHGVLPRTRRARRPASEPCSAPAINEMRIRGAALSDRRPARAASRRRGRCTGCGRCRRRT